MNSKSSFSKIKVGIKSTLVSMIVSFALGLLLMNIFSNKESERGDISLLYEV
jgi:hypothetical protein